MQDTLQQIVFLQAEYNAKQTPAMKQRGSLVRKTLPDQINAIAPHLRAQMAEFGDDALAEGRDNTGSMAWIPWVRWYSQERSPSATNGWYIVYLFHPDASGVSLCLSHGSTEGQGVMRSDAEVAELMSWAQSVVGDEFYGDLSVRAGIKLGNHGLGTAYERTTIFSKFYADGAIPDDAALEADLLRFVQPLTKLYRAQLQGYEPGTSHPDAVALDEYVDNFVAPLKPKGQGRGLSGPARKAVELHAMQMAKAWLKAEKFEAKDVSATHSCDFLALRRGEEWVVEVKGTTGGPGSILLTRNELTLHRSAYPRNVLLVVHGIVLAENGYSTSGGELLAYSPWSIEEGKLKPVCFEYKLI